jgi:hypothetical protein
MDNFWRRLKYYGIGFGIGLIFVIVLFRQKGCSWTPGNRVKSAILERIVFVDSTDIDFLNKHRLKAKDLQKYLENATVSFTESKRHGNEKIYHFNGNLGKLKSFNCLIAYREKSVVVDADLNHQDPKKYQRLSGKAKPFLFKNKNWFSGKLALMDIPGMRSNDAPEKFTAMFLKNGTLDASRTTFDTNTPFTYLTWRTQNNQKAKNYLLKTKWYQEKIEIIDVTLNP